MELYEVIAQYGDAALSMVIMGYWVYSLRNDLKDEREKIEKLNAYIKEQDKANIQSLSDNSRFIETLIGNVSALKFDLVREFDQLKTLLTSRNEKSKD